MTDQASITKLHLFANITTLELARLSNATTMFSVEKGKKFFQLGDPCRGFYGLVKGRLLLGFPEKDRQQHRTLTIVNAGEMFCEAIAFQDKPHPVDAIAFADCDIAVIDRQAMLGMISDHPAFALRMLQHLSRAMEHLVVEIRDLKHSKAHERVACFLMHYAPKLATNSYEFTLPVQKQMLAARLNMSSAHFSRALRFLEGNHIISIHGRTINVLDAARLSELVK